MIVSKANFVADKKDLLLGIATPSAQALYNATKETPILITAVTDPVDAGLVKSLEKTETNVTGTSDALDLKLQLELLKELYPKAKKVGVLYTTSEANSEVQVKENVQEEPVQEKSEDYAKQQAQVKAQEQERAQAQEQEQLQAQAEAVASKAVQVNNTKLKKPVEGKIIKDFAIDKLVYSKTLDEWSTHLGIDIGAKEGTSVLAPADGIVKQVINDKQLGVTIILDHGNDLETIYKNIGTADLVKTGQNVKTGDPISKVSKGIGFEKLDQPHLHFEVKKSGKYVNPNNFF